VVCGLGQVGYRTCDLLLRLGENVVVVAQDAREERRRAVLDRGARLIVADARDEARLVEAGLRDAKALLALTNHDLVNVEIALDAKRLRPDLPVVVRLFDQQLARHLERSFDLRRALGVSAVAAPTFAAAALGERWIGSFEWAGEAFVIGRLRVGEGSPLAGRAVSALTPSAGLAVIHHDAADGTLRPGSRVTVAAPRDDWGQLARASAPEADAVPPPPPAPRPRPGLFARVAAAWRAVPLPLRIALVVLAALVAASVFVFRVALELTPVDALYFIVTTVTTTGYGDITPLHAGTAVKLYACLVMILGSAATALLYSIITDFVVRARFRQLLGRERIPRAGHVVVAGLGNVGYRTAEELLRAGAEVVVVDTEPAAELVEAVRGRAPVVAGDARLRDTLERAGVDRAAAIVATTGDDVVNLGIALAARELRPGIRTDVRLFDADFARKARSAFQLDAALSASLLSAPLFVASALDAGVLAAFVSDEQRLVVLRAASASAWLGQRPAAVRDERGSAILWRRSLAGPPVAGSADDSPLRADEEVVVVSTRRLAR
jgi:Trk K+ transport system NAD-binding subunit